MTSDDFFSENKEYFDLIFIDGLHEANQVFRDIQNALRVLAPNGTIVLHDCNPQGHEDTATYPYKNTTASLCGDTYKAAIAMRMSTDLEIIVVDVDFGVGIIRRRQNLHPLNDNWKSYLNVNPISMLNYNLFRQYRHELIRLHSLTDMKAWLDSEF